MRLSDLPNISRVNEEKLQAAGIADAEQLKEIGSEAAFLKVRATSDAKACLHMLTALEGAIQGIRKTELSPEKKAELKSFYAKIKN